MTSSFLAPQSARLILQLRLLIARAAGSDSLGWWDDGSFSEPGRFILERTFPVAPPLAARSLALRAAWERHAAAWPERKDAVHLYRLDSDGQDKMALKDISLRDIPVPEQPIDSMTALREYMQALLDTLPKYRVLHRADNGAILIKPAPAPQGRPALLHRAMTLTAAYLEGDVGQPVFPYCLEE